VPLIRPKDLGSMRQGYQYVIAQKSMRLRFIQRALACGYSLANIARLVDEAGLTTCNDVYRLSVQRLEELRRDRGSDDATVPALGKLIGTCAGSVVEKIVASSQLSATTTTTQ
jgi:DNA-binding transcriptional MerR regulator